MSYGPLSGGGPCSGGPLLRNFTVIVNWYAPTQFIKDQIDFINFIKSHINNFDNENIIMGGDFNFYMDPELSKQKNMSSRDNNPAYKPDIITWFFTPPPNSHSNIFDYPSGVHFLPPPPHPTSAHEFMHIS